MMHGLLPSFVEVSGRKSVDFNVFVTAMAVRQMRLSGRAPPVIMLQALVTSRTTQGGFQFWPENCGPPWAPALPDDCDDTALATLELFHAGYLSRDDARRIACFNLVRHRVRSTTVTGPPWRRVGCFKTWARDETEVDLIDCTAQANVLALMAALDLLHLPGISETCAMLQSALDFAGDNAQRAQSLSPFYPTPAELVMALSHAVSCGVQVLTECTHRAATSAWGRNAMRLSTSPNHPVCSSPYGGTLWFAPKLATLYKQVG
jgi:hypothetical protein